MTSNEPLRITISALIDTIKLGGFSHVQDLTDCRVYEGMLRQKSEISVAGAPGASRTLSDLSPFEGFDHLSKLDISYNSVVDLSPLSSLSELQQLIANHNKVTDLRPIEYLSQLRTLELQGNRIVDVKSLAALKNLSQVSVASNHIADIGPVADLRELRRLDVSHNNIEKLDAFQNPYRLEWLNIDDNLVPDQNVKVFLTKYTKTCIPITSSESVSGPLFSATASLRSCLPH